MECLSDELLIESFKKARELNLSPDFLSLIKREIHHRNLHHEIKTEKINL